MHQALRRDDPKYNTLPAKQGLYSSIVRRLEKYTGEQMRDWMTEDYSTSQIFISMPDFKSKTFVTQVDSIKTIT